MYRNCVNSKGIDEMPHKLWVSKGLVGFGCDIGVYLVDLVVNGVPEDWVVCSMI